ncbi:protein kinase-like protein [Halogeometricum pallidum JCM 14848]|uniref:histidine kinase n=1 Tax=Halogeometricum pallidum JCM 14848 TaxID=1227487 RepID=M0DBH9_HALPD|nr:PAS domain-containing sensor histidine kinase [Halogeometricum pallidum]ELZ32816.1 protein kinase-like protein [Halogeometricum pallidum JCM 14848]
MSDERTLPTFGSATGESSDEDYRKLIERAVDAAVVLLEADGDVTTWNASARRLTGYDRTSARGTDLDVVLDADVRASTLLEEADASGRIEVECVARDAGGEAYDAHVAVTSLEPDESAPEISMSPNVPDDEGYAVVVRDVTDYRSETRSLERRNERLTAFASSVSHDLRNPLSAALAQLDIARARYPGDLHPHLDTAYQSLLRMNDRIDETLTLAREGARGIERTSVPLRETAERAWEIAGPEGRALTFDDPPETVSADEEGLCRLFENLFENAKAYAGDDATVEIGGTDEGFYVADDGPGIAPDRRDSVFEYGVTGSADGTGFGLAIVTAVVDAHDWRVGVGESRWGGARFDVVFDRAARR